MGQKNSKEDVKNTGRSNEQEASKAVVPADIFSDISNLRNMGQDMHKLFDDICKKQAITGEASSTGHRLLLTPVTSFITDLMNNARPPVIYILGKSGHGKSSLINALANKEVAVVGEVSPTTPIATDYKISFEGQNCAWTVVDSRGIFETTRPKGAISKSALDEVKKDMDNFKPDVILHVVSCSEVRSLHNDLQFLYEIFRSFKSSIGAVPPIITVLSKADLIGDTREWPPENHQAKQILLEELMAYMGSKVLSSKKIIPLDDESSLLGYQQLEECEPFLFIVPTAVNQYENKKWNIDQLSLVIGSKLPCQAWMQYYKAHKNKKLMKGLINQIVNRFSAVAAGLGAIPGPGVSLCLLSPLVITMVALIAKVSGKDYSKESVWEYIQGSALAATGAVAGATALVSFLALAEIAETILLGIGCAVGAAAASLATFCVGKAAEGYFFDGIIETPEKFKNEWKPPS